ncbi:MAG: hypothetical protein ABSD20_15835 [Terriglobales bacterium]
MFRRGRTLVFLTALWLIPILSRAQAQTTMQQTVSRSSSGDAKTAATAKAEKGSSGDEERGLQMLQMAEAEAGGLEGGMRAWALWQVGRGYEKSDKKKSLELLESALRASNTIENDKLDTRTRLQEQILNTMVPLAPERVDELLLTVDPAAREKVLSSLLSYYEKNKNMRRALEVIYRIGAEKEIPYDAAMRIMEKMTPEQSGEMLQLFTVSLASYRDHPDAHVSMMDGGGFCEMIVHYWQRFPKELVRQGIDEVLKQADPANQKDKDKQTVAMASGKGSVTFASMYEFRLFQLLPVLRAIDENAAEEYLKKYREVATMLGKYPDGTSSLSPPSGSGDEKQSGAGMSFSVSGGPNDMAQKMQEMAKAQKLVGDAEAGHAQDAMANAPTISDPGLRAMCYEGIARVTWKKDSSVAHSALDKMLDTAEKMKPDEQLRFLKAATGLYVQMGEVENAKATIEKGMGVAAKSYASDANADDPNKALKAYWPATDAYRGLLNQAAGISPLWTMTLLKEISDPEVKVASETALAGRWLNVPLGASIIMTERKGNNQIMMSLDNDE